MSATPSTTEKKLMTRPPIVVVMGHVDHGKTTLLDFIRKSNVAAREAGGITQSIGAYEIEHTGKRITFIDTPGHEAFSQMRSRGANAADLAILVVAAEEGPKPQTIESINILRESKTPFVVAITKADKSEANIEKVKNELTSLGVLLEGYGGDTSYQPVSGKTGQGIPELLDLLLLAAEIENLTYDPAADPEGFILETRLDPRRGMEASVIVKNGHLRYGDQVATPSTKGKVKILENFLGKPAKEIIPSSPALIIGWEHLPKVGELFVAGNAALGATIKEAKPKTATAAAAATGEKTLNLILKASDAGSLEALSQIIKALAEQKPLRLIGESVGEVTDNDVQLAISTESVIVAFKSKTSKAAVTLADANKVRIISSEIIYKLLEAIDEFLKELEKPAAAGTLEVLAIFSQEKLDKQLVGGKVVDGFFRNRTQFEIERNGQIVGSGRITSLQHNKKDTNQVDAGNECGLIASSPHAIQKGDRLLLKLQ